MHFNLILNYNNNLPIRWPLAAARVLSYWMDKVPVLMLPILLNDEHLGWRKQRLYGKGVTPDTCPVPGGKRISGTTTLFRRCALDR